MPVIFVSYTHWTIFKLSIIFSVIEEMLKVMLNIPVTSINEFCHIIPYFLMKQASLRNKHCRQISKHFYRAMNFKNA